MNKYDIYEARRQSIINVSKNFEISETEVGVGVKTIKAVGALAVGGATGKGSAELINSVISKMDFSSKSKTTESCVKLVSVFLIAGMSAYCVSEYNKAFDTGINMIRSYKIVKKTKPKKTRFKRVSKKIVVEG